MLAPHLTGAWIARGTDLIGGLRKRGISVAQDIPPRSQLVTVWSTGFCPGERSPETIFLRTGERVLAAAAFVFKNACYLSLGLSSV